MLQLLWFLRRKKTVRHQKTMIVSQLTTTRDIRMFGTNNNTFTIIKNNVFITSLNTTN